MTNLHGDKYYMEYAKLAAQQSIDDHKVGACLVKDRKVLSSGFNDIPKGFPEMLIPNNAKRDIPIKEQKYTYSVHAEQSAVYNYPGSLKDLEGATLYVTLHPCHDCAKMCIQLGIKEIVYLEEYDKYPEINDISNYLLKTCGLTIRKLGDD